MSNAREGTEIAGLIVIGIMSCAVGAWAYQRLGPTKTDRGERTGRRLNASNGGEPPDMVICPNPACRAPSGPSAESGMRCGSRLELFV